MASRWCLPPPGKRRRSPAEPLRQQVEEDMLAREQLVAGRREPEPFGAIDLREAPAPAAFRRPLDLEAVAADCRTVDVALAGIDDDPFGARHHRLAKQMQGALERDPELLGKLAPGCRLRLLAGHHLALGDRPGAAIPPDPE